MFLAAGWGLIVLSIFLCGCGPREQGDADADILRYESLARGRFNTERYAEAIAAYKKVIELDPDNADAHSYMGTAYSVLGKPAEAIVAYKKVIAIKPDYPYVYSNMAGAYAKLGQYDNAVAAYKKAVTMEPYPSAGDHFGDEYYGMGCAYGKLERHADATAAFQKAVAAHKKTIEDHPDNTDAYYSMGLTYRELGRHADATAAFEKNIVILKKDLAEALTTYPEAAAWIYLEMSNTHRSLEQYSEAVVACKKAIDLKPDYGLAYLTLGHAYRQLNQNKLALAAYEKCYDLVPSGLDVELLRKKISELSTTQPANQ